jgi:hypothetical protein
MEEGIMEKVVTLKQLQYEKQYREFFENKMNVEISRKVFMKCDQRLNKDVKKVKIS